MFPGRSLPLALRISSSLAILDSTLAAGEVLGRSNSSNSSSSSESNPTDSESLTTKAKSYAPPSDQISSDTARKLTTDDGQLANEQMQIAIESRDQFYRDNIPDNPNTHRPLKSGGHKTVGVLFYTRKDFETKGYPFTKQPAWWEWGSSTYRMETDAYNDFLKYQYGVEDSLENLALALGLAPQTATRELRSVELAGERFTYLFVTGVDKTDGYKREYHGLFEGVYNGKPLIGYTFYEKYKDLQWNMSTQTIIDLSAFVNGVGASASAVSLARNATRVAQAAGQMTFKQILKNAELKRTTGSELDKLLEFLKVKGLGDFADIARHATENADSPYVVLGKGIQSDGSLIKGKLYTKVAAHFKATYFKLDNWRDLVKKLNATELWKVNEAFLDQQIRAGKQIILSPDPSKATGFFLKEVSYLEDTGFKFVKEGWAWKAVQR